MGTSAVVGTLYGLSADRVTPVGVLFGVLLLGAFTARKHLSLSVSSSSTTVPVHDGVPRISTCLIVSALIPLWLPLVDRVVMAASSLLGSPLAGWGAALVAGAIVASVCHMVRVGEARATPRALVIAGLLAPLGVGTMLPVLGAIGTGLLGLIGWAIAAGAHRFAVPSGALPPEASRRESPPLAGAASGFALTSLGLIHLAATPWVSSDPFVIALLCAGCALGVGLGQLVGGRAAALGAGLATLGVALGAELPPALPGIARGLLASGGADDPALGYALPAALMAAVGFVTGTGAGLLGGVRRYVAFGALGAVALWQLGPGLLGADESAHAAAVVVALLGLSAALQSTSLFGRLLGILLPAIAAASVLLPAPAPETMPADEAWRRLGTGRTLETGRTKARFLTFDSQADADGRITMALRDGVPHAWQRGGQREAFDDAGRFADRFLGHLPALLSASPPRRVLIWGLGRGEVADAARKSSPGLIEVVEPSSAVRILARRRLPTTTALLADPAVRLSRTYPRTGDWDAIIIDVEEPWAFGAGGSLSGSRLRGVRDSLAPTGVAIVRLPLDALSPAELATAGTKVAGVFPTVVAWLDPVDAQHLVLTAWAEDRVPEARTIIDAWERDVLRNDLREAGLMEPADLLERALTDQQGLGLLGAGGRDAAGTAVVAAARVRRGKATLPLAALESAGRPVSSMVSLEGLPPNVRDPLEQRLQGADASRTSYLKLLSYLAAGKTKEALGLAAQLAESSTNPARDLRALISPWLRRGRALRADGKYEQAQAELATAYAFSPQDAEVNLALGRTLLALGRQDEAVPYVQRARDADPTSIDPVLLLADIRVAQGRLSDAADGLNAAEPLFPTDVRLLVNYGYVLTQLSVGSEDSIGKRLAKARVLFQRAASLAPRRPQPRAGLAEVYYRLGDTELALKEIDRALLIQPSCQYDSWRGHILADLSRLDESEMALQKAVLECPEQIDALVMLGAVMADLKKPSDAREMWERVLVIDPTNAAARENLAILEASKLEEFVKQTGP
ncbi:MAG: tetratricopeptide repeat protein [Deltaproteobacteria bacterium]|nr:tetratricopeptide repeat protein [Deltaproteobacteria bacterium]